MYLFNEEINCWDRWGEVFRSIPAFTPLAGEIYRREGLEFSGLENLTPGTNAVFRVGNTVVKIFFPKEAGLDPAVDFSAEKAVCGFLTARGVPTPRLLAAGMIEDRYDFYYTITEFVDGVEAGEWLKTAGREEKARFARRLRELLKNINVPADGLIAPVDLKERAIGNERLKRVPVELAEDMINTVKDMSFTELVLTHGDVTGENVLVDSAGEPVIIDCADACLAPCWYEYAPVVFGLFGCEGDLIRAFAGEDLDGFLDLAVASAALHDFGADILRETAAAHGEPPFTSLARVREFLARRVGLA